MHFLHHSIAILGLAALASTALAETTPRRVLLEFFSTERCTNCPLAHSNLERLFGDGGDSIIMLSHHAGFYDDAFTIPESTEYEWFYSPYRGMYAPAAMFDRTCFEQLPEIYGDQVPIFDGSKASYLQPAYAAAAAVPALADIEITTQYDAATRQLQLTVSGNTSAEAVGDLRLNVFLTEDSLFTQTQAGAYGAFYHHHSARQCLTGTWGETIYSGASFERSYTTTLPAQWNARHIDVVAFASYYNAEDRQSCQVLNAASASIIARQAADRFFFDQGGIVSPADVVIDQLDQLVIDYTHCAGTDDGLNPANGRGQGWILCDDGTTRDVTYSDDYARHQLTIQVSGDPIVKAGIYRLRIPRGTFNVYGNARLINEEVTYLYVVSGANDRGDDGALHLVSSYPAQGQSVSLPLSAVTLNFDRDITVQHSAFNAAGIISNITEGGYIQLSMKTEGSQLIITRGAYSSTDFMEGQSYELEIYADRIKAADDPTVTLPGLTLAFCIAKAEEEEQALRVVSQIPAAGEIIRNAGSITFNRNVTAVDRSKFSLVNERGHVARLSSVGRDSEAPRAVIFNIDPETRLQSNSTYHLMLEAGAVTAGNVTCEAIDAAYWCIPVEHFTFTSELANRAVPSFQDITLTTDAEGVEGEGAGICVTGVSTNADHVYAELEQLSITPDGIALHFDHLLTPETLTAGGALYNSVKVVIPEGVFHDGEGRINRHTELIIYIIEEQEIGEQTWTFTPASGSAVKSLGRESRGADDEGNVLLSYYLQLSVTGTNVNVRIPDGSLIYMVELLTGQRVHDFQRNDITGTRNSFTLELGAEPITAPGIYQLVIPAEAIFIHSDANYLTLPIHPDEDVTAQWTVGDVSAITTLTTPTNHQAWDVMGRRTTHHEGLRIENGRVIF